MACAATMKRSHEFDPLMSPGQGTPTKRRRCTPMTLSPSMPTSTTKPQKRSVFSDTTSKLTSEQIAAKISLEIRRMQKRRQLHYQGGSSPPHYSSDSPQISGMESPPSSSQSSSSLFTALSPSKKDIPLFTFRQVSMICDRMIKDREEQIQGEYDGVLSSKLAEQYEAFLKFNHDQLHRRYGDAPMSYVS